ncbi:MAG: hypothetical protein K2Q01_11965, partial [Rickettsiales bacterium]|nr:hypothetical protein [Rickettsiales bacterium]
MPPKDKKPNFTALVSEMAANGAFDDYPAPLGKTRAVEIDPDFHNPSFPGEGCYGNGPKVMKKWRIDLPADLIMAQRQSFKDAIRHYMPEQAVGKWMHSYFAKDFTKDKAFRQVLASVKLPNDSYGLDDQLSLKLDAPERSRHDRKMYTQTEIRLTAKICQQVPALALTVIAYQASHLAYLTELGKAISADKTLRKKQRKRGEDVVKVLAQNWSNNNFMHNILPAVALHYYENHNRTIGEKPTEKDFADGMQFAVNKGMFRNEEQTSSGEVREFVCPAKGIVTRMSMPLAHEQLVAGRADGEEKPHESGVGKG